MCTSMTEMACLAWQSGATLAMRAATAAGVVPLSRALPCINRLQPRRISPPCGTSQGGSASGIRRIKGPVWPGDRESPTSRGAQTKKCPDDPRLCSPGNLADGVLQRKATQGTEVHPQCEREPHQMSASVGTSIASITPAAIATGLVSVAYAPGASLPRGDHVAHKALHLAYAVRGYYHRWTNWGTRREMRGSRSTRSSCRVQNAAFSSPLPTSLLSKGGPGQAAKSLAYKLPRRTRPPFVNRWMKNASLPSTLYSHL